MADSVTRAMGSPFALAASGAIIILWAVTGPIFGFSDTWQLAINTGTTIVTFLMVFVIQNSQNRDAKAVHAKLDELIRAVDAARNEFVDAEEEPEETLDRQLRELRELARAQPHLSDRIVDGVSTISRERGGSRSER
ncbi:MAG: low affinity iron permease family protein [Candidatus Limnocylindrales bacterium]